MNDKLYAAAIAAIDRVLEVSRNDDTLRTRLRAVAQELLALTEPPQDVGPGEAVATPDAGPVGVAPEAAKGVAGTGDVGTDPFDVQATLPPAGLRGDGLGRDIDVPALIERLALKADAARWAAERRRLLANNADPGLEIAPQDRDFFTRAEEQDCYLWMIDPRSGRSAAADDFEMVAACFNTLAEAVAAAHFLLQRGTALPDEVKRSLTLLAEAQSALRFAVSQIGGYSDDDQQLVYRTVRAVAADRGFYIATGLKLDDPVDPSEWAAIVGGVHALLGEFEERDRNERRKAKLLANLTFKASKIASAPVPEPDAWKGLVPVVEDLAALGVQPSRVEIRDALLPIVDQLPPQAEVPKPFGLVLREIEKFRGRVAETPRSQGEESVASDEVQKAASLLAGKSLLLIGGVERPEARKALEQAFGLKSLDWVSTTEHEPLHRFEPYIARPDIAAVLLLIRWSSHSFGELKAVCDRHGKPLVRLPGGYNPNQVAAAILTQASRRLDTTGK